MSHITRRLLTGSLLVLAAGTAVGLVPATAYAAGASATAKVTSIAGKVRTADGMVNLRSGPSTQYPVTRTLGNTAKVSLVCAVQGPQVAGTVRTTTQWDKLVDGTYISHAYVVSATVKACPAAPVPVTPAPVVQQTPQQFIAAAAPGAQQGWRQYGVPASVTIAQAILESGWGRSSLSSVDRNYFGIKCQNGSYGVHANGCHVYKTQECTKAGKCFDTADAFRTYATMSASIRDHGHFLKVNKRYAPAFAHTRNANKFIAEVRKAGYATDPHYVAKVTGIMKTWNLYQYDTWK